MEHSFDVILKGGRILDGTGNPSYVADIGIRDGEIARIGHIHDEAGETTDLCGQVVAPGFIDIHNHCDHTIQAYPDAENYIRQGVTTLIGGNCGISMMPLTADSTAPARQYLSPFLAPGCDYGWDWRNVGGFAEKVEAQGITPNLGFLVGHGTLRLAVKGFAGTALTPGEMDTMKALLAEAMEEGAFGLSAGLIYAPGSYADTAELSGIASLLKAYDGLFAVHVRNESTMLNESIEEAVRVAGESGANLEISHLKAGGRPNWGKVHGALAILEEAREQGINATCDAYPYPAGMTTITALLPPGVLEGGVDRMLERLGDRDSRQAITRELQGTAGFENWIRNLGFENITIAGCPPAPRYEGMRLADILAERPGDPYEAFFDWMLEIGGDATMVLFSLYEGDVETVLAHPLSCVISDGWITSPRTGGRPHPRGYGTYPRFLGRYVRERRLLRLEEAVRKITSLPARIMGITDRGMVREGYRADLVTFDPAAIRDTATFDDPHRFPEGIDLVMVNGTAAVRRGELTGARPGQIVRRRNRR